MPPKKFREKNWKTVMKISAVWEKEWVGKKLIKELLSVLQNIFTKHVRHAMS